MPSKKKKPKFVRFDKWELCKEKKPKIFDLVRIQDEKGKTQIGWWTGTVWDYGIKQIGTEVMWKREGHYTI